MNAKPHPRPTKLPALAGLLLVISAFLHPHSAGAADSPLVIPFQGQVTNQQNQIVADGQYSLIFNLYDVAVGGQPLWTERHSKVGVVNGMVNLFLGSITSLSGVNFSQTRYLGITVDVDDKPTTADPEMVPRQMIIPAFHAKNAEKMQGYEWSNFFTDADGNSANGFQLGSLRSDRIGNATVGYSALMPDVISALGGTLQQGSVIETMTALEPIGLLNAVAVTTSGGVVRLFLANSSTADRSAFYGIAKQPAAAGQTVVVQQFGPLAGYTGLVAGSAYYLAAVGGGITPAFPATNPVYVGYALSDTTLFIDPFGVTRNWARQNYWGDGSDGSLTTAADVNLASVQDGDVVVKQYGNLTINAGHTMTVANRCRGLVIYVNGNCTIDGTLTMTKRGAFANPTLADSIAATGIRLVRRKTGGTDSLAGSDVGGAGSGGVGAAWRSVEALQPGADNNGKIYTIAREGGVGGTTVGIYNGGSPGGTHVAGTGGGGSGSGSNTYAGGAGAGGTCFSGGSGGGSPLSGGSRAGGEWYVASAFGGLGGHGTSAGDPGSGGGGGGAGNPGGTGGDGGPSGTSGQNGENGTGGLLLLFVRGNLTIGPGGLISANGARGGNGGVAGAGSGGGSGGGRIIVLHAGSITNPAAMQATGGAGGSTNYQGKTGGNGAITIDQILP